MNITGSTQSTINLFTRLAEVTERKNETDELKTKTNQNRRQLQDSVEISGQTMNNPFENVLSSLVSDGTITEDQKTAVVNAFQAGKAAQATGVYNNKMVNPLDSLAASGTITEEQKESIKAAFSAMGRPEKPEPEEGKNPMKEVLSNLVSSGTITEEQQEAIEKALEAERKSAESKLEEGSNPIKSFLESLAENGTITEEQQEAIKNALETGLQEG